MSADSFILSDPAILATLLSLLAALGGYFAREWQMRARPFSALTSVEGDFRRGSTIVEIPPELREHLRRARYITRLQPRDSLDNVFEAWREARELCTGGGALGERLEAAVAACEAGDPLPVSDALARLLSDGFAEKLILYLVVTEAVTVPEPDPALEQQIPIYESAEHEGSVWINFPSGSVNFGRNFQRNPLIRVKSLRLVELIARMDCARIAEVCAAVRALVQQETTIAVQVEQPLRRILNANSYWETQVYLANMSRHPILVQRRATLHVTDSTGARFEEPCRLVRVLRDEGGAVTGRRDASGPLVVASGEAVEFSFFTERAQAQMDRGQAFREAFESGKASCRIVYDVESVGLFRRAQLATPAVGFHDAV